MTPAEFIDGQNLPITEAVKLCAQVCGVKERIAWHWLAGNYKWKPATEKLLQIFSECTDAQRATWWPQ